MSKTPRYLCPYSVYVDFPPEEPYKKPITYDDTMDHVNMANGYVGDEYSKIKKKYNKLIEQGMSIYDAREKSRLKDFINKYID